MTAVHLPAIVGIRPEGWVPAIGLARVLSDRWPSLTISWDAGYGHLVLGDGPRSVDDVVAVLRDELDGMPDGAVLPGLDPGWPPKGARPGTDLTVSWQGSAAVEWQSALIGRTGDLHPLIVPHAAQTLAGMLAAMVDALRRRPALLREAVMGLGLTEDYGAGLWILRRTAGRPARSEASPGRDWLAVLGVPWMPLTASGDGEAAVGWRPVEGGPPRLSWSLWLDPVPALDLPERLQVADLDPHPQHVWARSRASRHDPPMLRHVQAAGPDRSRRDARGGLGELVPLVVPARVLADIDDMVDQSDASAGPDDPPATREEVIGSLLEGAAMAAVAATPPKRGPGQPRKWDEPTVALRLRLPESLHAALVQAAAEHGRSLNDEVLARCRDAG